MDCPRPLLALQHSQLSQRPTMHPSLRLAQLNLNMLPRGLQNRGKAAANKSLQDWEAVAAHCLALQKLSRFYIPFVHANLDPLDIPKKPLTMEDDLLPDAVLRAVLALQVLTRMCDAMVIDNIAKAELWARVWPWVKFLENIAVYHPQAVPAKHPIFTVLIGPLQFVPAADGNESIAALCNTPGVLAFCGRVWDRMKTLSVHEAGGPAAFVMLHIIISSHLRTPTPAILDELSSDLANGSRDLMSLIVGGLEFPQHCDCHVMPVPPHLSSLLALTSLAAGSDHAEALLEAGALRAIIGLLGKLNDLNYANVMEDTLKVLILLLDPKFVDRCLPRALDGVMSILAAILTNHAVDSIPRELFLHLLYDIIPAALIHRDVASQCASLSGNWAGSGEMRADNEIRAAWDSVLLLFQQTATSFAFYRSPAWVHRQMCHNPDCKNIQPLAEFKRCAGCGFAVYCDRACQKAGWKRGHRGLCKTTALPIDQLDTRQSRFIRYIVFSDYQRNKFGILLSQLEFMYERGPKTRFVTVFDYRTRTADAPLTVAVIPLSTPELDGCRFRAYDWGEQLRTGCHVVLCPGYANRMEVHLWSTSNELADGLLELLALLPQGIEFPSETELEAAFPEIHRRLVELSEWDVDEVY
ncbi:MYND-type domain-containing protein [Mycena indigotica]|uniref:MYND-type domain-containing protein n=1 Tax=Mycena indigotica TaxID=2126181 RepID=A0A8H6T637_9AGAR|nr:MYND-type domain-containing protein [Mycena indigotica]KAF7312770.1 MYND-type domain-containing protein [Mycena indigotica]